MHPLLIQLTQATTTTVAKSSKSSGSYWPLLIILGLFALVYFLFLRPRQQRMRQQQTAAKELGIGDQVVSAGGIFGRVVSIDADAVEVEVAPGVIMTFLRRAISPRPGGAVSGAGTAAQASDEPWPDSPGGGNGSNGTDGSRGSKGAPGDQGSTGEDRPPAGGSSGA